MEDGIVIRSGGVLYKNIENVNLILGIASRLLGQIEGAFKLVLDREGKGDFRQVTRKDGLG
jgi:hypothetical protein